MVRYVYILYKLHRIICVYLVLFSVMRWTAEQNKMEIVIK